MNSFNRRLDECGVTLARRKTEILQINVGKLCNLTCIHCHVNAGPKRKEIITRETVDSILDWYEKSAIPTLDLTGGAPEMIPDFRYLVERVHAMDTVRTIINRCNLTILLEPGYEWLAEFLCEHRVKIVASMPCYSPENVNEQRGEGVFDASITGLQMLNALGYGTDPELPLDLVYNPNGAFLPGSQTQLEADYKRELKSHFGIVFDQLYTITNMPIARFASYLRHHNLYEDYLQTLVDAFNPGAVDGLMCHNTLSVDWKGMVYDCDFNQQLGAAWAWQDDDKSPLQVWHLDPELHSHRPIATGTHCFGCTAGAGSSCGGALVGQGTLPAKG